MDVSGPTRTVRPDSASTTSTACSSARSRAGASGAANRSRCSEPAGQAAIRSSTAFSSGSGPQT